MVNSNNSNSSKKAPAAPATVVNPNAVVGVSSSSSNAGSSSTPTGNGGSSTPGSTAGSGSVTIIVPSSGQLPPPTTLPGSGFRDEVTSVVAGIEKNFLDDTTLVVNGQSVTKASLLTSFGNVETLYDTIDTVVQQLKSERLALKAALPAAHQLLAGLKAVLIGLYGKGNPVLESFGFSAKPRQLTPEQKLARAAKAAATRKQRGTSGARQKAANKFTGTVQVQTSVSGTQAAGGNAPATGGNSAGASTTPASPAGSTGTSTP